MRKITIFLIIAMFLLIPAVTAKDYVVTNSDNWKDIYSGAIYAMLQGKDYKYLISDKHSSQTAAYFKKEDTIEVIESDKLPFVINYVDTLKGYGFDATNIKESSNTLNIHLAELSPANSFILIDSSYGYDAVSIAPYAKLTQSYVLFADRKNIDELLSLFQRKSPQKLLIYGDVDPEVKEALLPYAPEMINKGSRYDNNIEIVQKYMQIKPTEQLILSSGEILEEGTLEASHPLLFIGKDVVPDRIVNFVKNSKVKYAILIGNELTKPARQLKELTGVTIFIKFAQGRPILGQDSTKVAGLDMYYLPSYERKINLTGVRYNLATQTIDVALQNMKDLKTYLRTTVSIWDKDKRVQAAGDEGIEILEEDDRRGFSYPADLSQALAENRPLDANVYTIYGEAANFMDRELNQRVPLMIVDKEDFCEMEINGARFDEEIQRIIISVTNIGQANCFVDANIADLVISDETTTAALPDIVYIEQGNTTDLKIKQRMDAVDLEDNKEVHVRVYYGEERDFLFKKTEGVFELQKKGKEIKNNYLLIGIGAAALLIIIIAFLKFRKPSKKKRRRR